MNDKKQQNPALSYKLLKGTSTHELEDEVNIMLRRGWKLHGDLVAFGKQIVQPVIQNGENRRNALEGFNPEQTFPGETVNERLKSFLDELPISMSAISDETGINRRTLYDLISPGASIKLEYLQTLSELYGLNINDILDS